MSDLKYKIDIFTTHFKVVTNNFLTTKAISGFINKFDTYTLVFDPRTKRYKNVVNKTFAGTNYNLNEFRFAISTLQLFIWELKTLQISKDDIRIRFHKVANVKPLNILFNPNLTLRDYQEDYKAFLLKDTKNPIKLISLATGRGKTTLSSNVVCVLNQITAIIILPKYIDKWIGDLKHNTNATDDDIMVIKGRDQLEDLVQLALDEELSAKFIIFSNRTIYFYLKEWELIRSKRDFNYTLRPELLMSAIGAGTILIDEVHQEFYTAFMCSLYFNVNNFICLSATLETEDKHVSKMYQVMFPNENRKAEEEVPPYIYVYSIRYQFKFVKAIRHVMPGVNSYNHIELEKSILRNSVFLNNYIDMIVYYIEEGYMRYRVPGDKLAIFGASIEFCTILTRYLKNKYHTLDVRRYVEDDPYVNVIEADIRVTTALSSGTAIDIPNLITVIQTVNTLSIQSNKQTIGRLRDLPGKKVRFYFLWSNDIKKHVEYTTKRREIFRSKTKEFIMDRYQKDI